MPAMNNGNLCEKEPTTIYPCTKTNTKEKKYLGINSTKSVQDLYAKSYETLMKEVKEDMGECRSMPYSWAGGSVAVKRSNSLTFDLQVQFDTNQILQNI